MHESLPYEARLMLALEHATLIYEERDYFFSDDDLLDVASCWTTDSWWMEAHDDYARLLRELEVALFPSEETS